jgi:hypothetical protein
MSNFVGQDFHSKDQIVGAAKITAQVQLRHQFVSIDAHWPRADTGSIAIRKRLMLLAARPLFVAVQFQLQL